MDTIAGIDHSNDAALYEQFMNANYFEEWQIIKANKEEKETAFEQNKKAAEKKRGRT